MKTTTSIPTLDQLLAASAATAEFRAAAVQFAADQKASDRIQFPSGRSNPPVKVLRAICGLLEFAPQLAIDRVSVSGEAGCSDYRGEITVNSSLRFRFVWDCAWRAEQAGLKDWMGSPDQQKAAREFGYRCFEVFEAVKSPSPV